MACPTPLTPSLFNYTVLTSSCCVMPLSFLRCSSDPVDPWLKIRSSIIIFWLWWCCAWLRRGAVNVIEAVAAASGVFVWWFVDGLSVDWCIDEQVLEHLLDTVEEVRRYGIVALRAEVSKQKVPINNGMDRETLLTRLCTRLAWKYFSYPQLEAECSRRGLETSLYEYPGHKPTREQKRQACITRLVSQAFSISPAACGAASHPELAGNAGRLHLQCQW